MSVKNIHTLPNNKLALNYIKYMENSVLPSQSHESCLEKHTNIRNNTLMTFTITKMLQIPFSCNYIIIPKHLDMLNGAISKGQKDSYFYIQSTN